MQTFWFFVNMIMIMMMMIEIFWKLKKMTIFSSSLRKNGKIFTIFSFMVNGVLACLLVYSIHFKWISLFLCEIWWVTFMQNILADSSQWHQTLVSFQFLSDRPFSSIHRENKTVTRTFYSMLIYKTWWWLVYPFSFFCVTSCIHFKCIFNTKNQWQMGNVFLFFHFK